MARDNGEQLTKGVAGYGFMERGMAHACANRKYFPIARKLIEPGNPVDIHEVRRLREAKRHDGDEALAARQHTAIFRCHFGQDRKRLIKRLRRMVNEGRGFHVAKASAWS
jgi:3-hydroxyacyl-CoA dehydrogenase